MTKEHEYLNHHPFATIYVGERPFANLNEEIGSFKYYIIQDIKPSFKEIVNTLIAQFGFNNFLAIIDTRSNGSRLVGQDPNSGVLYRININESIPVWKDKINEFPDFFLEAGDQRLILLFKNEDDYNLVNVTKLFGLDM